MSVAVESFKYDFRMARIMRRPRSRMRAKADPGRRFP